MTEFSNDKDSNAPNYITPGSTNPFHENSIGQGPSMILRPDSMVNFRDDEPADPNLDAAIANRSNFRTGESLSLEQVVGAEDPQELFEGLRAFEKRLEDGNTPGDLNDHYSSTRLYGMMCERADVLKISPDELVTKGWIKRYDRRTGVGYPKNRKYAPLALSIDEEPDAKGYGMKVEYNFGTPEKRAELAKAYERAIHEFEARAVMGSQIGLRLNPDTRDGLETLVVYLRGGRTSRFKAAHLDAIFNMPDVAESERHPENKKLGDQVEQAMFLNLIMLNSGTKQRMTDFLERPGSKFLIAKMAGESSTSYDRWVFENIGDYRSWVEDTERELYDDDSKGVDASYKTERRGLLTKWANISAFTGKPGEFGKKEEDAFIEKTVGGLVGSVEAAWVAATMMKVIGAYASEGYVALPNGKSALPLGEDHYMSSDDTGKFWAYMQVLKEGTKGRSSFLKGMIGKIPDMSMNLFDWAQVRIKLPDGTEVNRSIWDAWLGTTGGKNITDILTGKSTGDITVEEGYHRLGDLDFKSLPRDFHGKFATMQWLMGSGKEPTGVLNEAFQTDFRFEDFALVKLKKINKYVGIVFNPIVLTKGSQHLYNTDNYKLVQKNFMRNLMLARIHSASFSLGILNAKIPVFNPNLKTEVPAAVLVKAFVDEVLNGKHSNEDELINHYIDENKVLRTLGSSDTSGLSKDISALLDEKFEPEKNEDKKLMNYVGKVTGKKSN